MRNLLLTILVFSLLSCRNTSDSTQITEFHNLKIKIPSSLKQKSTDSCKNVHSFSNPKDQSHLEFKLCNYGLKTGRQTYESLNNFFQEECEVLKEEIPESTSINKMSKNYGNYYVFTHDYKIGEKYYVNNYIAYDKYYLTITFQSTNQKTITELKNTVEALFKQNLSDRMKPTESNDDCYYCKSPLFW